MQEGEVYGRLERLISDEVGECCEGDVEERVSQLEDVRRRVPEDVTDDVSIFAALSGETRYRIVRLLIEADDELCVCELAPLLDVSESAVSHALSDLTDAGLVSRRKEGNWRYYAPTETAERAVEAVGADP